MLIRVTSLPHICQDSTSLEKQLSEYNLVTLGKSLCHHLSSKTRFTGDSAGKALSKLYEDIYVNEPAFVQLILICI